jgi:hypothetical protein
LGGFGSPLVILTAPMFIAISIGIWSYFQVSRS